jgi:hypothetical protein
VRFVFTARLYDGGIDGYQSYGPWISPSDANLNSVKIKQGPIVHQRFFAKMDMPPTVFNGSTVALAAVYWNGDPYSSNLELDATADGIAWNARLPFTQPMAKTSSVPVSWQADFVCVEWTHKLVVGDAGTLEYQGDVSINGQPAGSFRGGGVPSSYSGFNLGTDVELRPDIPNVTTFTQWFDEVKFSDQPIGCQ